MSLHYRLRPVDRRRTMRALAGWTYNDRSAFETVLAEAGIKLDTPAGRLTCALIDYCDFVTRNTGPLTLDQPADLDPRGDQP